MKNSRRDMNTDEIRGLPIDSYHRPIARYEIRFSVWAREQNPCGLPLETAYRSTGDVTECAIILLAYTAEDALTDLRARLDSYGWMKKNTLIESVLPTDEARATLRESI
jgi:hypothetical protein